MFTRRRALQAFSAILGTAACGQVDDEADNNVGGDESELNICIGRMDRAVRDQGSVESLQQYDKFVVLVMENRSFDHYFGHLTMAKELGGEGRGKWDGRTPDPDGKLLDGLTGNESNPDLNGNLIKVWNPTDFALGDIAHEWDHCHSQFNNGRMDGFINTHQRDLLSLNDNDDKTKAACWGTKNAAGEEKCGSPRDPMAFYKRAQTPIFHSLLDNYAICDRYFCSVMGATWSNRYFINAANARGEKGNVPTKNAGHGDKTIWQALRRKCLSTRIYYQDVPWISGAYPGAVLGRAVSTARIFDNQPLVDVKSGTGNFVPEFLREAFDHNTFEQDCREGTLPTVSIIDPGFLAVPNDDHPPHDVQAGQTLVAAIYKMLSSNEEQWKKTLFIITYDEHGSFYDHVAPPRIREDERDEFNQLGFRVPALIIGPHVKKNYVSHVQYDHSSLSATFTRRFKLDPLNDRVRTAASFEDCMRRDSGAADPILLPKTVVRESQAHESIAMSMGQSQLAERVLGGPISLEQKKIATDKFLEAADRLGVASVR